MPYLGVPLQLTHIDNTQKMATVLTQLLALLKVINLANYAHMDLRGDNILVHPSTSKASIIDFDHTENVGFKNIMARSCPETPPEGKIHSNSDMWQLGVMLWGLLGTDRPQRLFHVEDERTVFGDVLHGNFMLKGDGDYVGRETDITKFVDDCLNIDPTARVVLWTNSTTTQK